PPPPPTVPAPSASDVNVDVRATPVPQDEAVSLDYAITNVSKHAVQVLGELSGTYWYRERHAGLRQEGNGPIEVTVGAIEGCERCITDERGVAGNLPRRKPKFETLAPEDRSPDPSRFGSSASSNSRTTSAWCSSCAWRT